MKLLSLLGGTGFDAENIPENINIDRIIYDTRSIGGEKLENALFVCLKGYLSDGHDFAMDAYAAGARVFAVQEKIDLPGDALVIRADNTRRFLAAVSSNFFGNPAEKMTLIGITGTKGKTSTAFLLRSVLQKNGGKPGLIGSLGVFFDNKFIKTVNTTPESYELHKFLRMMLDSGCDSVIMEAGSVGIKSCRTYGLDFDIGIFTNITTDHISAAEHKDFDEYLYYKKMIFKQSKICVVNADDGNFDRIISGADCPVITYGIKNGADFVIKDIILKSEGKKLKTEFRINDKKDDIFFELSVPGYFSVYNASAAIAAARLLGVPYGDIAAGLKEAKVKGIMEPVPVEKDFSVIIDFAHNGVSIKALFDTLKQYDPKRIISVFGCGGNRARDRRYSMGEVIAGSSDLSIITSDNSRYENIDAIITDILTGVSKTNGKYIIIKDRKQAIEKALDTARSGDVVLLIGKGYEDFEEINGIRRPFDEREIVRAWDLRLRDKIF